MASLSGLHLRSRLQKRLLMPRMRLIRLVVCDVHGVLTDSGVHYDEDGRVVRHFDVRDGLAVRMLQRTGPATWTLSTAALVWEISNQAGAAAKRARHDPRADRFPWC
jgi:3-deoxy-D-manno-octulosonate 8-phosphate phosphatase (KDO 8-P phosphatase)